MDGSLSPGGARQHHKRTHEQMTAGNSERTLPWPFGNPANCTTGSSLSSFFRTPNDEATLFNRLTIPGHQNMDSLREASTSRQSARPTRSEQDVIDLTSDDSPATVQDPEIVTDDGSNHSSTTRATRPPHYDREIIDVDALPDQTERGRLPSPDVEVTYSRPARLLSFGPPGPHQMPPFAQPVEPQRLYPIVGNGPNPAFYLSRGMYGPDRRARPDRPFEPTDDDLQAARTAMYEDFGPPPFGPGRHHRHRILQRNQHQRDRVQQLGNNQAIIPLHLADAEEDENFRLLGIELDYTNAALRVASDPPARRPTYDPPPPAREGFTRSPGEEDVIVCPNCDDELGVGDTEEKRSVWFVRGCGHVYCGECAQNRQKTKRNAKSPRKTKVAPFKTCAVCDRTVTARTAMKQIFL